MAIPYKLYGSTELEYIREKVIESAKAWILDWIGDKSITDQVKVTIEDNLDLVEQPADTGCYRYENNEQNISVLVDTASLNALLAYIVKIEAKTSLVTVSDIARAMVDECLIDIIKKSFFTQIKSDQTKEEIIKLNSESSIDYELGSLCVELCFADIQINFIVPYSVIENISSISHQTTDNRPPLESPENCDIHGHIKVLLNVGSAELDYGTVANVTMGDVIRLNSKIDEPLTIYTEDNQYVCQAYLGKQGSNKAAKLILTK